MISAILTICLVSLTPFPSLPIVIYYYSKLGFIDGFIVVTIASNLKILIHYNLGRLLRSKKINLLNLGERISKIAKKYKSIKTKDILLIRLSNLFITRILNIFLGFMNFPLRKTFFINNIAILPWQLLYFYFATKVDFLSEILINYGVDREKFYKMYLPEFLREYYVNVVRLVAGAFVWVILSYPLRRYWVFA